MKRKLFLIVSIVIILFVIFSFIDIKKRISTFDEKSFTNKDLIMEIKNNTLSKTGATILYIETFENPDFKYEYTPKYKIEKKIGKYWIELKHKKNWGDETIAYQSTNGKFELEVNWKNKYGTLKAGNYRIISEVINLETHKAENIFTEFCIN